VDDVALYGITRQAASILAAMLLQRSLAAAPGLDQDHWGARRRLVKRQVRALDSSDRPGLVAQQEAWAHEIDALEPTQPDG
jgi:hypothetical protein